MKIFTKKYQKYSQRNTKAGKLISDRHVDAPVAERNINIYLQRNMNNI